MKLCKLALVAGMLVALLALPALAQPAPGSNHKPHGEEFAGLTPDQQTAVEPLFKAFRQDMKGLHETMKTAREKLMADHKAGADEAAIKADRDAVKAAFEAIKTRVHTFLAALKPLVPAEFYDKVAERWHNRLKDLAESLIEHHEGGHHPGSNTHAEK
jgi:hypothetical protein